LLYFCCVNSFQDKTFSYKQKAPMELNISQAF
jgi:hypothetical protein